MKVKVSGGEFNVKVIHRQDFDGTLYDEYWLYTGPTEKDGIYIRQYQLDANFEIVEDEENG